MKIVLRGLLVAVLAVASALPAAAQAAPATGRTPVVLFPAYHLTRLRVTVHDQTVAPDCPRSGGFEYWFQNDHPSAAFPQTCQDRLLTLRYDPNPARPMPARFAEQRGVTVRVVDYGRTRSAPFYEPLYRALESAGYVRDADLRVAGYDARLTPDMAGFLPRAKRLVEDTYRDNGNRPVHLVGHSNGPLYAQYLLTHTSRAWRARYIHGFTPIAGNFPGQGLLYSMLFTGLNIQDFGYPTTKANAVTSARMYLTLPSTYMSASDPAVFGDRETVIENTATGRAYTPRDYRALFADAHLPYARELADHYLGFVRFTDPRSFPYVDVAAEKGSGLPTIVGARLADLTPGQVLAPDRFLTRDGDANQEDITNNAVLAWRAMPCYRFSLTDNPGVDHFSLPSTPALLARLLAELNRRPSHCG
ncbi:lipase/acyltransferase domain-containing protein [Actinophytocola sp.]|uniref:lipase/acyltransferase domain-containing protein n=1 Tax=Actinophytocola sp. TaxID=1872138 RepID=UPI00389AC598